MKSSKCEWIKLIAGDDALFPTYIEELINFQKKGNDVQFIHTDVYEYDQRLEEDRIIDLPSKRQYKINQPEISAEDQYQILLRVNKVVAPSVMLKKELFSICGLFEERYKYFEDRPMWLKLTKAGVKLHFLDSKLAKYRKHQSTVHNTNNLQFHIKRKLAKHKFILDEGINEFLKIELFANKIVYWFYNLSGIFFKIKIINKSDYCQKLFRFLEKRVKRPMKIYNNKYI